MPNLLVEGQNYAFHSDDTENSVSKEIKGFLMMKLKIRDGI